MNTTQVPGAKQHLKLKQICPGLTRIVAYPPELAAMLGGDVDAALFLAQLCYWDGKQWDTEHRFIRKSQKELEEELGMSRDRQKRARQVLVSAGLIEVTKKGRIPPTLGFRINIHEIGRMWAQYSSTQICPFGAEEKEKRRKINRQNLCSKKSPHSAKTGVGIGQNEMLNNEDTIHRASAKYIAEEASDLIGEDYFKDDVTKDNAINDDTNTPACDNRVPHLLAPRDGVADVKDDISKSSFVYHAAESVSDGLRLGGGGGVSSPVSYEDNDDEDDESVDAYLRDREGNSDDDVGFDSIIEAAARLFRK